uniref:Uncharacterized protein n=1 Tax=Panagrolaimus sp. ES5 TaxID=591445 RepID=A0AC34F6C1_9BILA
MEINASFNIAVESANFNSSEKYVYKKSGGFGEKCCKTEELLNPEKRFIVNGNMTIKVQGVSTVEMKTIKKT